MQCQSVLQIKANTILKRGIMKHQRGEKGIDKREPKKIKNRDVYGIPAQVNADYFLNLDYGAPVHHAAKPEDQHGP